MNIHPKTPIFNRLLMKLNPAYFNMSVQDQESFRLELTDTQYEKAGIFLLETLFNIKTETKQESDAAWEKLNNEQKNLYNAYMTLFQGLGENAFYFNEFFAEGSSLRDFETLYGYDLDDFNFQQQARKEEANEEGEPAYQTKPYRLYLPHRWARLIDDGYFYYSTISSLSFYLHGEVEEYINQQVGKLIPHTYREGCHHGKREGDGGKLWDMRINANGLEGQLEELKRRCYRYEATLIESMDECYHKQTSTGVYLLPRDVYGDPHLDVVVQNSEAAKCIRFQTFLRDCRALQRPNNELECLVAVAKEEADQFVHEQYQDVMTNFDPKVREFKKRRKIVIAPGAQDDLGF